MSKGKFNLVVTAHPDDESIYMAGLLQQKRDLPWWVICVTDGGADGDAKRRHRQFLKACRLLKVKRVEQWDFPDLFAKRLNVEALIARIRYATSDFSIENVFTHGPFGEYGHKHHQDVCFAVHLAFAKSTRVYSLAENCYPDLTIELTKLQFTKKCKIYSEIYFSETQRFSNILPVRGSETYARVGADEVRTIYEFLARGKSLQSKSLKKYAMLWLYRHEWLSDKKRMF